MRPAAGLGEGGPYRVFREVLSELSGLILSYQGGDLLGQTNGLFGRIEVRFY